MNYYDNSYYYPTTTTAVKSAITGSLIWTIVALVLAVIGGIVLYFTVFSKKNDGKYKGVMKVLYDLVHFKYFVIDDIYRILYIVCVLAVTLLSFNYIGKWQFLVVLVGGNLVLRISFECFMLFINLCYNVRDLANKKK